MTEDSHPLRWRALGLLAVAELLAMSLWFAGTAVAPLLQARWSLDASQVGWLTAIVQLGFVVGTALAAVLNLADLVPSRYYVATCATLGALANGLLLLSDGCPSRWHRDFSPDSSSLVCILRP